MLETAAAKDGDERGSSAFALYVLDLVESVLAMARQAVALHTTTGLSASDVAAVTAAAMQALSATPILSDLPAQHQQAGSAATAGLRLVVDELQAFAAWNKRPPVNAISGRS